MFSGWVPRLHILTILIPVLANIIALISVVLNLDNPLATNAYLCNTSNAATWYNFRFFLGYFKVNMRHASKLVILIELVYNIRPTQIKRNTVEPNLS